ncbi:PorV/PorQ family protein [bacterium]
MTKKKLLVSLIVLSLGLQLCLASNKNVGTTSGQFLKIGLGGKPTGMSGAYTGIVDDVSAIYWNPGGLGFITKKQILAQHIEWFQDIKYEYLAYAHPIKDLGTLGVALHYLYIDDIERRLGDTDLADGTFGAKDRAGVLSFSRIFLEVLSVGLNLKYISSTIDNYEADAFAFDLGFLYKTPVEKLNCGLVVQNLGTKMKFIEEEDPLPLIVKLGFGYKPFFDDLTCGLDVNFPNDNDVNGAVGLEYALHFFKDKFCLPVRAGYKTLNDFEAVDGLSAGIGFCFTGYGSIDVAWSPYGDLGDTYRMSVLFEF